MGGASIGAMPLPAFSEKSTPEEAPTCPWTGGAGTASQTPAHHPSPHVLHAPRATLNPQQEPAQPSDCPPSLRPPSIGVQTICAAILAASGEGQGRCTSLRGEIPGLAIAATPQTQHLQPFRDDPETSLGQEVDQRDLNHIPVSALNSRPRTHARTRLAVPLPISSASGASTWTLHVHADFAHARGICTRASVPGASLPLVQY